MIWSIESVYPNPFNPTVNIKLAVPETGMVGAVVFDVLGRELDRIEAGRLSPGYHTLSWTSSGPSGIYFVRMISESGWSDIRKVVFLK